MRPPRQMAIRAPHRPTSVTALPASAAVCGLGLVEPDPRPARESIEPVAKRSRAQPFRGRVGVRDRRRANPAGEREPRAGIPRVESACRPAARRPGPHQRPPPRRATHLNPTCRRRGRLSGMGHRAHARQARGANAATPATCRLRRGRNATGSRVSPGGSRCRGIVTMRACQPCGVDLDGGGVGRGLDGIESGPASATAVPIPRSRSPRRRCDRAPSGRARRGPDRWAR